MMSLKRIMCECTHLVRLEVASQRATAAAARRSAAASTMPLHHRDGHHSPVAPPRPYTTTHHTTLPHWHHNIHVTPSLSPVWYLSSWACDTILSYFNLKLYLAYKRYKVLSRRHRESETKKNIYIINCFAGLFIG